jgi:hypothetical protein
MIIFISGKQCIIYAGRFAEHSSPENFSPEDSSPEDSSLEKISPEPEDSSPG